MASADLEVIRQQALWFEPSGEGLRPLVERLRDARVVLIGEATHGTHEFYRTRAELSKLLILEHGFNLIAVEADWPDAYRVNRWVRGASEEREPKAALDDFTRFPRWMWRNTDIVEFIRWLRDYNAARSVGERIGFYGLDLYSLHRSIESVLGYLTKVDPGAAGRARARYGCFEMFGEDPQSYGYMTSLGISRDCEDEVTAQLVDLQRRALEYAQRDGRIAADEYFFAEQNARLITNAETYYRAMFAGRAESWNIRDRHMMETLDALLHYVGQTSRTSRAVVWAHNSHLGDARATDMARGGELNLGQLVRERFARHVWLVGFTTHMGTVTAARNWDEPAERRRVRPSLPGSYERLFHESGIKHFFVILRDEAASGVLREPRLERAIGVIYRPETERASHYFRARLSDQFDAVLHINETSALQPLETWAADETDVPETYPTGI
jgi:erythromycin esterase-like protein